MEHTQAGFVVEIRIGKMKVPVEFSIVKLDRHCVVSVLIHSPNETSQIETCQWSV